MSCWSALSLFMFETDDLLRSPRSPCYSASFISNWSDTRPTPCVYVRLYLSVPGCVCALTASCRTLSSTLLWARMWMHWSASFFYSIFSFLPQINRRRAGTYPETQSTLDVKIAPHRQRLRPVSRGVVKNGTHAELFKMHKKVSWRYALNPTESWKPPFWHFTPVFSSRQQRSEMHFPPSVWPSFSWTYSSQHNMSASVRQMMQFQQALAGVCVFMCLWLTTSPLNLGANLLT